MGGLSTELWVAILTVGAVIVGVWAYGGFRMREPAPKAATWSQIAVELGLERREGRRHAGTIDGFEVVVSFERSKSDGPSLHLEISGVLPAWLSMWPRHARAELETSGMGEVLEVGDPVFDEAFEVRGEEREVLATLDANTRAVLRGATNTDWILDRGVWRRTLHGVSGADLEQALDQGLAIVRALRGNDEVEVWGRERAVQAIARLSSRDPVLGVRQRALAWLLAHERVHPATRAALEAVCGDRDAGLQLIAARELGHLGTLARLAEVASESLRLEALEHLVRYAPEDPLTLQTLERTLRKTHEVDRPLREAALSLIEELALPGFEATLIALLDEHDDDLRVRVMRALGRVGSLKAVAALVPFRELIVGFSLKDTAKEAIFEIQARLGGPEHGSLSLADGGGELALVEPASD